MSLVNSTKTIYQCEKGQALVESIIVLFALIGIFATAIFWGKLSNKVQQCHMGARVLAFNAGDNDFAWPKNPENASSGAPKFNPDNFTEEERQKWEKLEFVWSVKQIIDILDGVHSGKISDAEEGKVAGGVKMLAPIRVPYSAEYRVVQNCWQINKYWVEGIFLGVGFLVAYTNCSLKDLTGGQNPPSIDEKVKKRYIPQS